MGISSGLGGYTPPGLVLVKSQTIGSAVSTVTISDCFSSNYDNYRITISGTVASGAGDAMTFTTSSGGTASTTGWYGNTFYIGTGAGGSLANASFSNNGFSECGSITTSTGGNSMIFDVQAPFASEYTRVQFHSADAAYMRFGQFVHQIASSYDGFRISTYGVTLTGGTIRVYGYRN